MRPSLSRAAQIRFDAGKWYLLHVGHDMYEVNDIGIAMMLLADGRTTENDMLDTIERLSSTGRDELARSLRDLLLFLDNTDLLAK